MYRVRAIQDSISKITIPGKLSPGYGTLYLGKKSWMLFIDPQVKLNIDVDADCHSTFLGSTAPLNNFINNELPKYLSLPYEDTEDTFFQQWSKLFQRLDSVLGLAGIPQKYKHIERNRLYYMVGTMLAVYPLHHARALKLKYYDPGDKYYLLLSNYMKENEMLIGLEDYRRSFKEWIAVSAYHNSGNSSAYQILQKELSCIDDLIKGIKLKEYLIDEFLTEYIKYSGVEHLEEVKELYDQKIADTIKRNNFHKLYQQYAKFTKGKQAPDFCLPDIQGRPVCLSNFRGYYVYIDVWATWCIPCCKEIPALKSLEEKLKGKNIQFVSISIDQNKKKWKTKVLNDQLGGIQLHFNSTNFRDIYQISLIPRFILIDPNGKILDPNMTRPSNPHTEKYLLQLFSAR